MINKNFKFVAFSLTAVAIGVANVEIPRLLSSQDANLQTTEVNEPVSLGSEPVMTDNSSNYCTENDSYWLLPQTRQTVISQYDMIIREVAAAKGYDWRFVSAIACAESRFDHEVVSYAGAVGLMQIMPVVAKQFKVDPMHMGDPHTNVTLGVELLDYIGSNLRFTESTPQSDRLSIILAGYNCGLGHVLDARRLAVKYGENPNSWDVVARYLELKSLPQYYEDEVVRCGRFIDNKQTLGFVEKVMGYYNSYCQIAML